MYAAGLYTRVLAINGILYTANIKAVPTFTS